MLDTLRAELAPTGVLRAAINLSNFLLVRGQTPSGDPTGPSPDMARAVAEHLGVPVQYICYPNPGALADDATENAWDIGNIGAEPERAKTIAFTAAYAEIEATYLVPKGSPIQSIRDVDRDGVRIGNNVHQLLAMAEHVKLVVLCAWNRHRRVPWIEHMHIMSAHTHTYTQRHFVEIQVKA